MCRWQVRCNWKQFSIHPQSSGSSGTSFLCWIWKYTLRLWYPVTPDEGGRLSGCTNVVPVATFWQSMVYGKESRISSDLQLYRHNKAFSPATMASSLEAPGWLKTLACSRNSTSVLIFVSATPLPIPWILEVVSHPRMAHTNKIFTHTFAPSEVLVFFIF